MVRDVLLGLKKGDESELGSWGFDVHHGATPPPAPPTELCLTGKITDQNNNPMNNVTVKIVQLNVMVQTGSDGVFAMPMQAAGSYTVELSKLNYVSQSMPLIVAPGNVRSINVQLISISGSLIANVFCNGMVLGGAMVSIESIGMSAVSDSNGIATLSNLSAGAYNVMASAIGKVPLTIPIVIEVNTTASIIFNLMLVS